MRIAFAAAGIAALAGIAVAGPLTFADAMSDFEARVTSYLAATPEVPGDKQVASARKALAKALAAIDKVQAKPSPLASVNAIARQDRALSKTIPGAEMASQLDQVASNAFEAASGEVQALRDDLEALPSTPAGDAVLVLVGDLKDDLAAALLLPTRAERLKELSRLVKVHTGLRKKYDKVVKSFDHVSILAATVNGSPYSSPSVFGSLIKAPGGGVASLTFSASAPGGPGLQSFVMAVSTENIGGFIVPGNYFIDSMLPVATAV